VDCDTDHCLVVAEVREKLAVNKEVMKKLYKKGFSFKKLNEVESKLQTCFRF
jgi:hypothetical protein